LVKRLQTILSLEDDEEVEDRIGFGYRGKLHFSHWYDINKFVVNDNAENWKEFTKQISKAKERKGAAIFLLTPKSVEQENHDNQEGFDATENLKKEIAYAVSELTTDYVLVINPVYPNYSYTPPKGTEMRYNYEKAIDEQHHYLMHEVAAQVCAWLHALEKKEKRNSY